MKRLLKVVLSFLLFIALLIGGIFCYLTYYFDINAYKNKIGQAVEDKTGRKLTIGGDIRWSIFPTIGVEINQISLGNASGFDGDFASASKILLQVEAIPLLHQQLKIKGLQLISPSVYLQQNAAGTNNWSDLSGPATNRHSSAAPTASQAALAPLGLLATLTLDDLTIKNAVLQIENKRDQSKNILSNINLRVSKVRPNAVFPLALSGDYSSTSPAIKGDFQLTTQLQISLQEKEVSLSEGSLRHSLYTATGESLKSNLHFAAQYVFSQDTLTLSQLNGMLLNLGNIDVKGKITTLSSKPKAALSITGQDWRLPSGLKIDQLQTTLQYQAPIATMPDIAVKLYQGSYQARVRVDHGQSMINLNAKGILKNVSAANLLKDLSGSIPLAGTVSFEHDLNTIGATGPDLMTNLTGPMSFRLDNGVISGMDLSYIFALAKAKLDNTDTSRTDSGQTAIGYMTGKMLASNGIVKNTVLTFEGDNYYTTGTGTIRLSDFYVDYDLTSSLTKAQAKENTWLNTPIPIKVTGIPPHLTVLPNFSVLFDQLLKQQVNKQSQKLLDRLTEKYGKDLGEGVGDAIERGLGEDVKNLPFGNLLKQKE